MADTFYAATRIKYGVDHENEDPTKAAKHETTWFEVGDEVTGLPVEEMQKLWNSGALTRSAPDRPNVTATGAPRSDEAQLKTNTGGQKPNVVIEQNKDNDENKDNDDNKSSTPKGSSPNKTPNK